VVPGLGRPGPVRPPEGPPSEAVGCAQAAFTKYAQQCLWALYAGLMSQPFIGVATCYITVLIEIAFPFAILSSRADSILVACRKSSPTPT
jgi:hypothetical protein